MIKKILFGLVCTVFILGMFIVGDVKHVSAQQGMSVSQLVDFFISTGVIAPDKVDAAKSAVSSSKPKITSFSVSPVYLLQGQTMSWSGEASKGTSDIKQYRVYVVGSKGDAWVKASKSNSVSFNFTTINTNTDASFFYAGPGNYTIRFEVEDISGGKVWQDRTVTTTALPARTLNSPAISRNIGESSVANLYVSIEDIAKLIKFFK